MYTTTTDRAWRLSFKGISRQACLDLAFVLLFSPLFLLYINAQLAQVRCREQSCLEYFRHSKDLYMIEIPLLTPHISPKKKGETLSSAFLPCFPEKIGKAPQVQLEQSVFVKKTNNSLT